MGIFKNQSTDGLEAPKDVLGGAFDPIPTGVYDATIKLAYVGKSQSSDAQNVTLHLDVGGKEVRETIYVTNRNGENYYKDKKDAKKHHPLPGWTTIDDICLLTTGEDLLNQTDETKTVKLWNFDQKKETNQEVQVFTGLLNKEIKVAILRQIEDKQKKNESSGKYENTGDTRTVNVIDKAFHPETGRTVVEYKQEIDPGEFMDAWEKRNAGKDRNRSKGASGDTGPGSTGLGKPGKQPAAKSLFG